MPLTDIIVKNLKPLDKRFKRSDEKGLYLLIHPNGGKYWQLKYRFGGKEKTLSFGTYPEISLKEARNKRDDARKQIQDGIDPSQEKKLAKLKKSINAENSFESVARQWHKTYSQGWTERYSKTVIKNLEKDIFPIIGFRPIAEISAPELLVALRKIEDRDALDIAKKMRQTCGQVFKFAIATGLAERNIALDLQGALKTRKAKHFNRIEEREIPELLARIENYHGEHQNKLGLKLALLTFVRTTELRGAKWSEIDFEKKIWEIPAERMKMKIKHLVPLCKQSLEVFKDLQNINGNREFVFPNRQNPDKFISENTLLYALYRIGYHGKATVHGFRSLASTILNESGLFKEDVIERQLAHGERNKIRAAYNHAQYLDDRRDMMDWWGDFIEKQGGGR